MTDRLVTQVESANVAESIVVAVADVLDADPLELDPLYESVDPDALNDLLDHAADRSSAADVEVTFTMERCNVAVDADRRITVTPPADQTTATAASAAQLE